MQIEPFDEDLRHRHIVPYDTAYSRVFGRVKHYVQARLAGVRLVHIGSTAVEDLRGKPMVDIAAVTPREDLREEQQAFEDLGFHRRNVWVDTDEKPYVCGSVMEGGRRYNVNVHICHADNPMLVNTGAFIEILRRRPDLRRLYESAKDRAHEIDPVNPEVYNKAKEAVIQAIQAEISKR